MGCEDLDRVDNFRVKTMSEWKQEEHQTTRPLSPAVELGFRRRRNIRCSCEGADESRKMIPSDYLRNDDGRIEDLCESLRTIGYMIKRN